MANQEQEQDKEEANASLSASPQQTEPDEPEDGVPPCPFDSLIDSYEAALPVLPTVRRSLFAKGANGKALRARWRWVMTAKHERGERKGESLDHWDMRTGRNSMCRRSALASSLDHWDMRTGRNRCAWVPALAYSLDHWDMRTGRNDFSIHFTLN